MRLRRSFCRRNNSQEVNVNAELAGIHLRSRNLKVASLEPTRETQVLDPSFLGRRVDEAEDGRSYATFVAVLDFAL